MSEFNTPVAIIFFNRPDNVKEVIKQIKKVKPSKMFLISDYARKDKDGELSKVENTRQVVEQEIDWDCEIIKNYAQENKGCYDRIANGASWVFEHVDRCIFLEDDNVPSESFFMFAQEMLEKYANNDKIYWICGGNYLVDYKCKNNESYLFTKQMFPCGWASWKSKWTNYDGLLTKYNDNDMKKFLSKFDNKRIKYYKRFVIEKLKKQIDNNERPYTWDHQWNYRIVLDDAYGIAPCKNLIHNIGIGEDSTHGGVELTKHLEGMVMLEKKELDFPLVHPEKIEITKDFENKIEERIRGISPILYYLSKIKKTIKGDK